MGNGTSVPQHEKDQVHENDPNIAAHVCIVNDLFSWDKELLHADEMDGDIVNVVSIVMREDNVDVATAQARLSEKVQQLKRRHYLLLQEAQSTKPLSPESQRYIRFLTTLASGNEPWSRLTAMYNVVDGKQQKPEVGNISFRASELKKTSNDILGKSECFRAPLMVICWTVAYWWFCAAIG